MNTIICTVTYNNEVCSNVTIFVQIARFLNSLISRNILILSPRSPSWQLDNLLVIYYWCLY